MLHDTFVFLLKLCNVTLVFVENICNLIHFFGKQSDIDGIGFALSKIELMTIDSDNIIRTYHFVTI